MKCPEGRRRPMPCATQQCWFPSRRSRQHSMREYLCRANRAHTAHHFRGEYTQNVLSITRSQNGPSKKANNFVTKNAQTPLLPTNRAESRAQYGTHSEPLRWPLAHCGPSQINTSAELPGAKGRIQPITRHLSHKCRQTAAPVRAPRQVLPRCLLYYELAPYDHIRCVRSQ